MRLLIKCIGIVILWSFAWYSLEDFTAFVACNAFILSAVALWYSLDRTHPRAS